MRRRDRNRAARLRRAVEKLPRATREAMLRGIDSNPIVVGAYVDRESGGICPMLAAHRNGGRTSVASFARTWDSYTGAKRPRLATRRELRTLHSLLEGSLVDGVDGMADGGSIAAAAAQIRAERAELAARQARCARPEAPAIPEPDDASIRIRRVRRSWVRPSRRYDDVPDLLAAAEAQLTEQETVQA
jgi:hypothetical protein